MARIKINDLVKEVTITKNDMENVKGGRSLKNLKKKYSIIISKEPMATASWWDPDDFYWDPPDEPEDPEDPIDDGWE